MADAHVFFTGQNLGRRRRGGLRQDRKTFESSLSGGKYIDILAASGTADPSLFSRPYLNNDNCDFSFSGLKTAVAEHIRKHQVPTLSYTDFKVQEVPQEVKDLCATVNMVVVETLLEKARRAMAFCPQGKTLCIAGGVAANTLLRAKFEDLAQDLGVKFLAPAHRYCGDNAAMVAYAGSRSADKGLVSSWISRLSPEVGLCLMTT